MPTEYFEPELDVRSFLLGANMDCPQTHGGKHEDSGHHTKQNHTKDTHRKRDHKDPHHKPCDGTILGNEYEGMCKFFCDCPMNVYRWLVATN